MDSIYVFISIAFIGSFGHCIGMCGGYVLSYTSVKINSNWAKTYQAFMHILYALGKASTYAVIGATAGLIGHKISSTMQTKGMLFLVLGVFMILLAISFIEKVKILDFLKIDLLKINFFKILHTKAIASQSPQSFYLYGILNGMIPCGFVYFAASSALVTSSWQSGALMMFLFGIVIAPALFIIGFSAGLIKQHSRKYFNYITVFLMMGYGIVTIIKGLFLINGIKPM